MSLHALATNMASKGRNGDSMLVHMTPSEVHGLQALAMKHGGSLTINPDTGLPEANFLKSLLPMIAGFALGPAGFGIMSSAMGAGALVGGLTGIATGSLSKGLMAGLGAYGGFGIGEGLLGAGGQELAASGTPIAENIASTAGTSVPPIEQINPSNFNFSNADKLSAGITGLGTETGRASLLANMGGVKGALTTAGMAAAPIAADLMVPTTTKMPTNTNPAYIRQYVTGDRPQAPRALAPVLASEWGARSFQDAYAKPMASGGIVALAAGGVPGYAPGGEIFDWFAKNQGKSDADIAAQMQAKDWTPEMVANATGTQNQLADYQTRFAKAVATPTTDASEFLAATKDVGLQDQGLANALQNTGMSQAAQYALTHNLNDVGGIKGTDFYTDIGYTPGAQPGDKGGLEGLYANINYAAQGLQNAVASGDMTGQEARRAAIAEMNRIGMSTGDLTAATGKTLAELFPDTAETKVVPPSSTSVVPGATKLDTATTYDNGAFGNYGSGNKTGTDYLGREVSIATPGDIITNPDDTRTVVPNLPGRPYGGYTGIDQLKSAYTAGGGSTGYVSPVVKTAAEHNAAYNKMTDDSLDAYNYLIGKAGAKYPTKSRASEIMKPYEEAVLGYPTDITKKKYINVDGKMVLNPKYVAPQTQAQKTAAATAAAKAGKPSTIEVVDSSGYDTQTITAVLQDDGTYLGGNGKKYTASGVEIMAQGGVAGYAVGGGLGTLGGYSDGGRLLKGPGDGVSDSIPATIGRKQQPARLADGEFVVPARIVSELGNGSTDAGARKLYAMMDRVQKARGKTTGKKRVATNTRADKYLPA